MKLSICRVCMLLIIVYYYSLFSSGSDYIVGQLNKWSMGHAVRTALACGTFGWALYRLASSA